MVEVAGSIPDFHFCKSFLLIFLQCTFGQGTVHTFIWIVNSACIELSCCLPVIRYRCEFCVHIAYLFTFLVLYYILVSNYIIFGDVFYSAHFELSYILRIFWLVPARTCFFKHAAEVRDSPKFLRILRIEFTSS
jgi:hypothetical protein